MSVAEAKTAMARAYASGKIPKLDSVSPDGANEIWTLGGVLFLLPAIPANAPPEVEYALRLRRDAYLSGQCDMCGAALDVQHTEDFGDTNLSAGIFPHKGHCLAADENIYPMMSAFYEKRNRTSGKEALAAASRRTEEKILAALPDGFRVDIPATGRNRERFLGYLDRKIATAKGRCQHLQSGPAQTWHTYMWDETWRCDECNIRFAMANRRRPLLSPIEEYSCDYCRRYSPTYLQPTLTRVSNFLLYGAACRRCAGELEAGDKSKEVTT
jgi:hypothetical protein